ncbi:GNAT family N-acetyltransferase [Sphingosinicella rhizophila]|uniref:GNAT family N-acetyltransferase n=1 Tax=Sphingosinicella rhizophila TaxID=3050082 RepID=A0ABU3Q8S3_9SPHN|nr:GNAT family N-acetyltransferase [Sphingosinicella sp. GR2756]MDT9599335.1 GNAT family N-acetyltransferase [Sphingosinicella sp. GR2756]
MNASDAIIARIGDGVASFEAADWDRCAGAGNPFLSHAFLASLEESGSATARTGWQPVPLAIDGPDGRPAALMPAYVKSHSQGEYIFDHGWAEAYQRAGGAYYPKLQIAVPFTPVPGRRLLTADPDLASGLIGAAEALVRQNGLSSAHATFIHEEEVALFERAGWLIRFDSQFHWHNDGYRSFEDFLGSLSSRKRKAVRKERREALAGLEVQHLTGAAITEAHWDHFWRFYQDTGARKWGRPYLTRAFFSLIGERMADRILLIFALSDGIPVAGALNLIGADTLYGRYWGATIHVPHLHFEICYYQAIDAAIAMGLQHVEAGAQGAHKLSRGYRPVQTYSAHYLADPRLRRAVADYLAAERPAVLQDIEALDEMTPFRRE